MHRRPTQKDVHSKILHSFGKSNVDPDEFARKLREIQDMAPKEYGSRLKRLYIGVTDDEYHYVSDVFAIMGDIEESDEAFQNRLREYEEWERKRQENNKAFSIETLQDLGYTIIPPSENTKCHETVSEENCE